MPEQLEPACREVGTGHKFFVLQVAVIPAWAFAKCLDNEIMK
jgi:hypothetical protein